MANLGSISQIERNKIQSRPIPYWYQGYLFASEWPSNMSSTLSGNVKVGGVNQVNSKVYIYYRPTGKLVKQLFTDSSGNFTFSGLSSSDASNYFAVAITDNVGNYNAVVYDKLTPG